VWFFARLLCFISFAFSRSCCFGAPGLLSRFFFVRVLPVFVSAVDVCAVFGCVCMVSVLVFQCSLLVFFFCLPAVLAAVLSCFVVRSRLSAVSLFSFAVVRFLFSFLSSSGVRVLFAFSRSLVAFGFVFVVGFSVSRAPWIFFVRLSLSCLFVFSLSVRFRSRLGVSSVCFLVVTFVRAFCRLGFSSARCVVVCRVSAVSIAPAGVSW
jgi:hypothetical protein